MISCDAPLNDNALFYDVVFTIFQPQIEKIIHDYEASNCHDKAPHLFLGRTRNSLFAIEDQFFDDALLIR